MLFLNAIMANLICEAETLWLDEDSNHSFFPQIWKLSLKVV